MANHIFLKTNQFLSFLQQYSSSSSSSSSSTSSPSPSSPPPNINNNILTLILLHLKEWLLTPISLFFFSLLSKLNRLFPPEARAHWLTLATQATPFIIGGLIMILFLWCCLPAMVRLVVWVVVTCWNILKSIFIGLWSTCKWVFKKVFCCCCGRRSSVRMMKGPGTEGRYMLPRDMFEANPSSYFRDLRGGKLV